LDRLDPIRQLEGAVNQSKSPQIWIA
jgi:hypothetical protein